MEGASNFAGTVVENFMENATTASAVTKAAFGRMGRSNGLRVINGGNRYARASLAMNAVPASAEGDWGDVKREYVIGGNWKSNGDVSFINSFPDETLNVAKYDAEKMSVVIAPTDIHLHAALDKIKNNVNVASQDVSQFGLGAYTGNVTAGQMKDMGISWTLTGHSERRSLFHETDEDVAIKTKAAIEEGMTVMLCIGEQLEERESGKTGEVNARQLKAVANVLDEAHWENVVVAYEPVWAIGTGKVATPE